MAEMTKKTPAKMVRYLKKIENLGLKHVRVLVPAEDEGKIVAMAEGLKLTYLGKVARNAADDDPRLTVLADSRLATAVKPEVLAGWRRSLTESHHRLFDKKVLTMQEEWLRMVTAVQEKHAAMVRGDEADARQQAATAAVAAMAYRATKDDLMAFVRLYAPHTHISVDAE